MTVIAASPGSMVPSPSSASLSGLDGLNFFVAGMLAGFGPYVAVYLADQKWTQEDIGFALTAGGLAALISQLPGGELVDIVRSKRVLVAVATVLVAASAVMIGFRPAYPLVLTSLVLQGVTGGFLGSSITAISLGLVGLSTLSDRLGRNQRFASIGNLAATGLMGLIAYFLSYRAIFIVVAALSLPIFAALAWIDPADIHFGRSCGAPTPCDWATATKQSPKSLEELQAADIRDQSLLIPTSQCLHTPAYRRISRLSAREPTLTDYVSIDNPAADHRCGHGSVDWTRGAKLGAKTAAAHRLRRSADPRSIIRLGNKSFVPSGNSVA